MTLTASEILSKAADLIEPEGAWTQGEYARDANGNEALWDSDSAACFCAKGAIYRVSTLGDPRTRAFSAVRRVIGKSIPSFNDDPLTTQAEVVAALRKAAELASSAPSSPREE